MIQGERRPWFRIRGASGMAQAVTAARKEAGLSQEALAERLGVSRLTVVRLETQPNTVIARLVRTFSVLGYDLVAVPRGSHVTIDDAK
jgi:DNA-binding XRE family transcriptional regulator